jgi:peroxiredoxin
MVAFLSSCGSPVIYRIDGKLANLKDETLYAVFESEDKNVVDTIVCNKPGQFRIEQAQAGFNQVTLFFEQRTAWFTVYLEPNKNITITGDIQYPSLIQAKGGRINNELTSVRKQLSPLLKERTDLLNGLNHSPVGGNDLTSRLANVNYRLSEMALAYIHDHPAEAASVVLIKAFFLAPDDTRRLDELLAALDPKLKEFYLVEELEQYSERAKRTALGAEAPGFSVKNIYGASVGLKSFRNQYLLLTFTAPWRDGSRIDNLYLNELYGKYRAGQLEQLIVSLDDDMQNVRKILKQDSIRWNLVTDSAGQASMLIDLYNVNALPKCFLIDGDGTIALKTDNGIEIKHALERLIPQ